MLAILLIRDCISTLEQDEALFIKVSGSTHGERFKNDITANFGNLY